MITPKSCHKAGHLPNWVHWGQNQLENFWWNQKIWKRCQCKQRRWVLTYLDSVVEHYSAQTERFGRDSSCHRRWEEDDYTFCIWFSRHGRMLLNICSKNPTVTKYHPLNMKYNRALEMVRKNPYSSIIARFYIFHLYLKDTWYTWSQILVKCIKNLNDTFLTMGP